MSITNSSVLVLQQPRLNRRGSAPNPTQYVIQQDRAQADISDF